jgi:D-glycero-alpha-D-manno-heptose-7-phosphate kinase
MIISKTPYRVSFFGGGSDYPEWYLKNGGEVISSTVDKYLYISCRHLPNFFSHKHRIVYSKIEEVKKITEIKHSVVRELMNNYDKYFNKNGVEIHYDGDLPARSGMGSSSCFVVGMIQLINHFLKKRIKKKNLALQSINFEQVKLKEIVGSQDQIAASYGGFNNITFSKDGNFKVKKLLNKSLADKFFENIFLIYTGQNRTAQYIAKTYVKNLNHSDKNIHRILEHVKIAKKLFQNSNFDDVGKLLNETWNIKRALSNKVSNDFIDDIYNLGMKNGSYGGKLLGAGGGGFVLFYVPKKNHKKFRKKMNKFEIVNVKASQEGCQIIYDEKN